MEKMPIIHANAVISPDIVHIFHRPPALCPTIMKLNNIKIGYSPHPRPDPNFADALRRWCRPFGEPFFARFDQLDFEVSFTSI
jgi:hypothetical protein